MDFGKLMYWFKSRKQRIADAFRSPIYAIRIMRTFFSKGAVEVKTIFEHNGKKYVYETLIQIDGDIFLYLPDPTPFDSSGIKTMESAYLTHKLNVEKVVTAFQDNANFFSTVFDGFLLLINLYPLIGLYHELVQALGLEAGELDFEKVGINSLFVIASIIVRKYFRPQIISLSIKAITSIGKFFKWF